jgi:hypothetical protein
MNKVQTVTAGVPRPDSNGKEPGKIRPNTISHEKAKEGGNASEGAGTKACETGKTGESIHRSSARQNLVAGRKLKYKGRRADFDPFAASVFAPHIFTGRERARVGCGAVTLACLTGIPPERIAAKNRGPHYSDRFMLRFLKRRGFRVMKLSPIRMTSARNKVRSEHVILVSQLLYDYTATWGVIFDSLFFHNFKSYDLSTLALLNKPIISAYLVVHPSWQFPGLKDDGK